LIFTASNFACVCEKWPLNCTDNGLQTKGKNGVTATYLNLMNLNEENRSKRDGFLTVQVLRNSQIKTFKFNPCYKRLVKDLKELIENGFILPDGRKANVRVVQYRLYFVKSDSHFSMN
jgi:hypothetical protein